MGGETTVLARLFADMTIGNRDEGQAQILKCLH
jgi:hypothetical protein